jgi:hypothetical protein
VCERKAGIIQYPVQENCSIDIFATTSRRSAGGCLRNQNPNELSLAAENAMRAEKPAWHGEATCWLLQRGDKPTGIPAINLEAQKSEASSRPNHPRVHKTRSAASVLGKARFEKPSLRFSTAPCHHAGNYAYARGHAHVRCRMRIPARTTLRLPPQPADAAHWVVVDLSLGRSVAPRLR